MVCSSVSRGSFDVPFAAKVCCSPKLTLQSMLILQEGRKTVLFERNNILDCMVVLKQTASEGIRQRCFPEMQNLSSL